MLTRNPIEDNDELFEAIRSGAVAYLVTRKCSSAEIITTVERASSGEYPIDDNVINNPEVSLRVLRELQEVLSDIRKEDDIITPLNQREIEILTLIANGNGSKEVGDILGMSESGIKQRVSNILRKLNANNRAHAVVIAMRSCLFLAQPNISIGRRRGDILVEAGLRK
jgi:DNA-binding NarL/FixJ family response regulator